MFSIMLIKISPRSKIAPQVQELLTKHGCIIKTRLGLHEASVNSCSKSGLVILDLLNETQDEIDELKNELNSLDGVNAKVVII